MAEDDEAPHISAEDFKQLWRYDNLTTNDVNQFPEARMAMENQIASHPLFREELNGPEPCNPCGGRTEKSSSCLPYKCITYKLGFECSEHCHNNSCKNRRLSKGDYKDVMQIGASKVDPTSLGLFVRKSVFPGQMIGEFIGVLRMDEQVPERYCVPIGNPVNGNGTRLFLDATERGNVARNVQSSCHPNCRYVKLICGKSYRVGLIATKFIKKKAELYVDNSNLRCRRQFEVRNAFEPTVSEGPFLSSQSRNTPRFPKPKKACIMVQGIGPIGGIGIFKPGIRTIDSPIPSGAFRRNDILRESESEDNYSDDDGDDDNVIH